MEKLDSILINFYPLVNEIQKSAVQALFAIFGGKDIIGRGKGLPTETTGVLAVVRRLKKGNTKKKTFVAEYIVSLDASKAALAPVIVFGLLG